MVWHMDSGETRFPYIGYHTVEHLQQPSTRTQPPMKTESAFSFAQNSVAHTPQAALPIAAGIKVLPRSVYRAPRPGSRFPWISQQSENSLQGLRLNAQNDGLSTLEDVDLAGQIDKLRQFAQRLRRNSNGNNSNNDNSNNHRMQSIKASNIRSTDLSKDGHLDSSGSTDSTGLPPTSRTGWTAVVQRNLRPFRQQQQQQQQQQQHGQPRNRAPRPPKTYTTTLTGCCASPDLKLTCACCNEELIAKAKEELKPRVIPVATSQLGFCRFCQSNGDPADVYQSHSLRSDDGKVSCPVLREYNCPICNNGGGDYAHTIKYCPMAVRVRRAYPGTR